MHVLFEIVFKLLPLGREDLFALHRLDRDLWRELESITTTRHLPLNHTSHALLDHKGIHLDVGLQSSTVGGIGQAVVLVTLLSFKSLVLFNKDLLECFNGCLFNIKLLLDGINARLIFLQEFIKLI